MEVYYEVLCPDSRHFLLKQLQPTWNKIGPIMDVHLKPYGKASVSRDFCQPCRASFAYISVLCSCSIRKGHVSGNSPASMVLRSAKAT